MTKTRTPVWVKALLIAVGVGFPAWWLLDRHDRVSNQHRLEAIASGIAGRDVHIHCPGPIGRAMDSAEIMEGSVRFSADGAPSDEAKLRAGVCAELDALAEGRRSAELACVVQAAVCGESAAVLARAVDVLTHESFHLRGIADEAETECRSLQTMASTAVQLGATEEQARGLTRLQIAVGLPQMPQRYRSADCALPS